MTFELQHTDNASDARTGIITTDHGQIKTPIFMPVGTVGSVKGVHFEELRKQVKAQIILGNTYPPLPASGTRYPSRLQVVCMVSMVGIVQS